MRSSKRQDVANELNLIARAAEGNLEAYGYLIGKYVSDVYRHIYYLVNDRALAEDLTGQTFLQGLNAIHLYPIRPIPFLAWLLRIAYHLSINHKKLQKNGDGSDPADGIEVDAAFRPPGQRERIWDGMRCLQGDQRQIIVMRFVDRLNYKDIAQILGKNARDIRMTQYQALTALQQMYEQDDLHHQTIKSATTMIGRALADCLDVLDSSEQLEECLEKYPQYREGLRPLLEIALALHRELQPSPQFIIGLKKRLTIEDS